MLIRMDFPKVKRVIALPFILLHIGYLYFNVAQGEGRDSYIGIQTGSANTSFDVLSSDVDLNFLMIQLGAWMDDNTSLELRMGKGLGDDSIGPLDVDIESIGGMYLAYHWNLGSHASIYGIAGGSAASFKFSVSGDSNQDDYYSLSYGAGMKFSILSVEYMRYLDTTDVEADAISVGLHYAFD